MKIIRYGLREIGSENLLGFTAKDNGGDEQGTEWLLEDSDTGEVWFVDTLEQAEKVKNTQTAWYNASYKNPSHTYGVGELEVVLVEIFYKVDFN